MPRKEKKKTEIIMSSWAPAARSKAFYLTTSDNKPEWPSRAPESPMSLSLSNTQGCNMLVFNGTKQALDASNDLAYYNAHAKGFSGPLYAEVYTKFADAARQGSAEWGMNIIQGRQAIRTLVQLASLAAVTVTAFAKANRAGLSWLQSHANATPKSVAKRRRRRGRDLVRARTKKERNRISNEIFLLDQITSTLLAYRYGVAPLMSDLFSTAEILSKPFDDAVFLRKSKTQPWNGRSNPTYEKSEVYTGTESCVLRAVVSASNPNLLLANRLGLINPLVWAWDAKTPWSFVVDWWVKFGSFFSNLTAMVGLSLTSASVTRTLSWTGAWGIRKDLEQQGILSRQGPCTFYGKRKVRTVGSLPIPLKVPYGTGLGIQRGQNAIALVTQQLLSKKG